MLHKSDCNRQQVTMLSCKGLQGCFVACFRLAGPLNRRCCQCCQSFAAYSTLIRHPSYFVFVYIAQKTRYTRYIVDGQRFNPLQMPLQTCYRPATFHKLLTISSLKKSNPPDICRHTCRAVAAAAKEGNPACPNNSLTLTKTGWITNAGESVANQSAVAQSNRPVVSINAGSNDPASSGPKLEMKP